MPYTLVAQDFARGVVLSSPDGQAVYNLSLTIGPLREIAQGGYQQFALPAR